MNSRHFNRSNCIRFPWLGAEPQDIELAIVSQRVSALLHNLPAIGQSSPRVLLGAEYR